MRKILYYFFGTAFGGIVGLVSYSFILFIIQGIYPYDCGGGAEVMQYLPGACIHYYFGFGSVIICLPISLAMSLIGCGLVDTLYKGNSKYLIIVGGILAGLIIPYAYAFLVILTLFT